MSDNYRSFQQDDCQPGEIGQKCASVLAGAQTAAKAMGRPFVFVVVLDCENGNYAAQGGGHKGDELRMLMLLSQKIGGWIAVEAERRGKEQK